MQRAVESGEGVQVERYDSEDECESECNVLARLPPEVSAQIGQYLPVSALAAGSVAARSAGESGRSGLVAERAVCATIAERFPVLWRARMQYATVGRALRERPWALGSWCREWAAPCERPCTALLERLSQTFTVPLTDAILDAEDIYTDVGYQRWLWRGHTVDWTMIESLRAEPGNARFFDRPAPVRALFDVGNMLPVFLPGNELHFDGRQLGVPIDLRAAVLSELESVNYQPAYGTLAFYQEPRATRAPFRTIRLGEERLSELVSLSYRMLPPPEIEMYPAGEDLLEARRRYVDYASGILGIGGLGYIEAVLLDDGSVKVEIHERSKLLDAASRYFATNGFPVADIEIGTLVPLT